MNDDIQDDSADPALQTQDADPDASGWDPYILSIFSRKKQAFPEERRRRPRTNEANRRRAQLVARSRRRS